MHSLKIDKNKCTLSLNSTFYPITVVQDCIKSFNSVDNISVSDNGEIVIETKGSEDLESTAYHLCDHILEFIRGGDS